MIPILRSGLCLLVLCWLLSVAAHPLGEFVTNRYSNLLIEASQVTIDYAVDMAEIPSFQERPAIDQNSDGIFSQAEQDHYLEVKIAAIMQSLHLVIDGKRLNLAKVTQAFELIEPEGGLMTMRLAARFVAALPAYSGEVQATYRDENFATKEGWQEIVVHVAEGVRLVSSTVPAEDMSQALRNYPANVDPPQLSQASFVFEIENGQSAVQNMLQPREQNTRLLWAAVGIIVLSALGVFVWSKRLDNS